MTVSSELSYVSYNGDGATLVFTVPLYFLQNADLAVSVVNSDGTVVGYVLDTNFTLTGAGNPSGGTLTLIGSPIAVGKRLTIDRDPPVTQETAYQANDPFPASEHEKALDKLTMLVQRLGRIFSNALHFPISESTDGTLPQKSSRLNMMLGFDPVNGAPIMIPLPASIGAGDIVPQTFADGVDFTAGVTTQLTLSRAPGAPGNLEVFFDGVFQGFDQWSVAGTTLTFTSAIPLGVSKVFARIGTTLSTQIPPNNSISDAQVAANAGIQSSKLSYLAPYTGAVSRTGAAKFSDVVTVLDFGGTWNGVADVSAVAQAALNSGAKVIDFLNLPGKIITALTIPADVEARNVNLTAGTAGMSMVLVNNRSRVTGTLTGTGTKSIVERGIYPAADGVEDVYLDVLVQNMTFGVQAQPIGAATYANSPKRWRGRITAKNIVGTVGTSEGYALLLSPAYNCKFDVFAYTIQRHAVYLSAGAANNIIDAEIDGIQNVAVQFNTLASQPATELNTVRAKVRNMTVPGGAQGPNQVVGCYILGNSHRNKVELDIDGAGTAEAAVTFEGVPTDVNMQPTGNHISGRIKGQFLGADVIKHLGDACNTTSGCTIDAYATFSVIALRSNGVRSGAGLPFSGPRVHDNAIKALGQNIIGIYDEVTDVPTYIGPNDVRNNGSGNRVQIQANVKRTGFSRRVYFSGTSGSIANGATGDTSFALSDVVSTTGRNASARITAASVTLLTNSPITAIFDSAETNVTVRIFNSHSAAQTFNITGVVEGD